MVKILDQRDLRITFTLMILVFIGNNFLRGQEFLQHRTSFKLDNWKFYKGEIHSAESAGAIDETGWQEVSVPHTWNAQDVLTDGPRYYQGVGWYRTNFNVQRDEKNKRFFVRFEGVSLVADVFLNDHYLGSHKGGYSAFTFEITPFIRTGQSNRMSVKVNNITQMDVAPSGTYLYPLFGGIYRPVTIFCTDDVCISPLDYASSGVYIHPIYVSKDTADLNIETLIDYRSIPITKTQSPELLLPEGKKGIGLYGEYFSNPEFSGKPTHATVNNEVLFDYGNKSPFEDMPIDNFSVIWTGRFIPSKSGFYKFILKSDDGSRLYFDSKQVIDNWGNHAALEKTYEVFLDSGKEHQVKIEYYEQGGDALIMFGWMFTPEDDQGLEVVLSSAVIDKNGIVVADAQDKMTLKKNKQRQNTHKIHITNPRLWNAKRDPYQYTIRVSLKDMKGQVLDIVEQPIGVRFYKVDRDRGLILNGEPYPLYGVCRHQEWEGLGPALSDKEHERDFSLIRELGANGIRFAHYQQADIMYRLCDENGLIAWAEIPNTPAYRTNLPSYLQNCKEQLTELIKQNYNHPSIFFWGLYNEIDIPKEDVIVLNETAKQLDPHRLTTQADFVQVNDRHSVTDVSAWNWYFGWYYGNFDDYLPWYDKLHKEHANLKGGLSEYGAEACISQQQENPERPDPVGRYFPEQYQRLYHEEVWKRIKDRQDIWCKFIWNMFDFSWTYATRGDKPYMNNKGLVSHNRKVKKDAFYFYKANWSDEPVLYIVSRRNIVRKEVHVPVEVYSNLQEVELYVNGVLISKKPMESDIHKITWKQIELKPGKNQINVIGYKGDNKFTDACEWEYIK